MDYDYLFKIIVIGDCGSGKSSILARYVDKMFTENFMATIGVDFKIKTVTLNNKSIKLQLWDTAGQERFRAMTLTYYRSAHAILLMYDGLDSSTFDNLNVWLDDACKHSNLKCQKILVGCKYDHDKVEKYQVGKSMAEKWATDHNMSFIDTSAKDDYNINLLFTKLCEQLVEINSAKEIENKKNRISIKGIQLNSKPKRSVCC